MADTRNLECPYIVWASGEVLTKEFPKELFDTDRAQLEWILKYVTEDHEGNTPPYIYNVIDRLAESAKRTFNFKEK